MVGNMATNGGKKGYFIIIIIIIIYLFSVQLHPGASHRRFYDGKSNKNFFRSRLKVDLIYHGYYCFFASKSRFNMIFAVQF